MHLHFVLLVVNIFNFYYYFSVDLTFGFCRGLKFLTFSWGMIKLSVSRFCFLLFVICLSSFIVNSLPIPVSKLFIDTWKRVNQNFWLNYTKRIDRLWQKISAAVFKLSQGHLSTNYWILKYYLNHWDRCIKFSLKCLFFLNKYVFYLFLFI